MTENLNCPPVKILPLVCPEEKQKSQGIFHPNFSRRLLMVAPYAKSPFEIEVVTELNSKPYVDMTIAIMKDFGIEIERENYSIFLHSAFKLLITNLQLMPLNPMPLPLPISLPRQPSAAAQCV